MHFVPQDLRYLQEDSSRRKASYLSELRGKDEELEAIRATMAAAKLEDEDEGEEDEEDDEDEEEAARQEVFFGFQWIISYSK